MYELRPEYQVDAHEKTIEHYLNERLPAFHDHSVGAGKSVLIAFFAKWISDRGERFLCLSRQGEIAEQNAEDAWAINCKCSVFSASLNKKSTYYPVVYGTEGTIARALTNEFRNLKFDALAIDECHEVDWENVLECIAAFKKGVDFYNEKDDAGKPVYSQYALIITHLFKLNGKLKIIGYSGSPFRGSDDIKGSFWSKRLSYVPTMQLVGLNYLVPPVFGFGDDSCKYDYSEFDVNTNPEFSGDYTKEQLRKMSAIASKDKVLTQQIIEEVVERTRGRLGVLITCAGKKHCDQVASFLPDGSYGIVTDSTSTKKRREILKQAKDGEIKYVIQINCLGQGVNVPRWCTLVLLRKIGSRRYLTQLSGRILRLLKPYQIKDGLRKFDGLILDYSDTFESMGGLFSDDPIVSQAVASRARQFEAGKPLECQKCGTYNGEHAVRCCAVDTTSPDGRCDYFFKYNECACGAKNAPTAKSCRVCDAVMIDPNKALVNKAYTDADYKAVKKMELSETTTGKLCVTYHLATTYQKNGKEYPEVAKEYFNPIGGAPFEKQKWYKFIEQHIQGASFRRTFARLPSIKHMVNMKAMLDQPNEITHRMNDKYFSIVNSKKLNTGREELNG